MVVRVTFHCGGCDAVAEGTKALQQRFVSLNGRGFGIGHYAYETALDAVPLGWVAYDTIGATYCPKCADELWPAQPESPDAE